LFRDVFKKENPPFDAKPIVIFVPSCCPITDLLLLNIKFDDTDNVELKPSFDVETGTVLTSSLIKSKAKVDTVTNRIVSIKKNFTYSP
jgi:hypothetical protein